MRLCEMETIRDIGLYSLLCANYINWDKISETSQARNLLIALTEYLIYKIENEINFYKEYVGKCEEQENKLNILKEMKEYLKYKHQFKEDKDFEDKYKKHHNKFVEYKEYFDNNEEELIYSINCITKNCYRQIGLLYFNVCEESIRLINSIDSSNKINVIVNKYLGDFKINKYEKTKKLFEKQ